MELNLAQIIKDLENFFEINAPEFEIILANSRQEFDSLTNQKSEPWMAGWANGYKIVVIHPKKLEELTNNIHKPDSHPCRIKHEIAHIFYKQLTKGETKPVWLNEGLAYYLDGRGGKIKNKEQPFDAVNYFKNNNGYVYNPGSFMVKNLLDKFGKNKILELIKKIHKNITEEEFNDLFFETYGFYFTKEDLAKNIISQPPAP